MIFEFWKWVVSDRAKVAARMTLLAVTFVALGVSLGLVIRTVLS